jgi:hypothetical protein
LILRPMMVLLDRVRTPSIRGWGYVPIDCLRHGVSS